MFVFSKSRCLENMFFVKNHVFDSNIRYGVIFGDKKTPEAVSTRSPRWVVDDLTDQFPTLDHIVPNPDYIVLNLDYILAKNVISEAELLPLELF